MPLVNNKNKLRDFLIEKDMCFIACRPYTDIEDLDKVSHSSCAEKYIDKGSFKPRKDVKEIQLGKLPIDWDQDPLNDINWRMQLHGLRCLIPLALAHDQKPKIEYIYHAFQIIFDWADSNLDKFVDIDNSKLHERDFAWYDMSTGLRALFISYFTQEMHSFSQNELDIDINKLKNIYQKHSLFLGNMDNLTLTNHGIFQLHGLMSLVTTSKLIDIDDMSQYAEAAKTGLLKLLKAQFGNEGMHMEHSPSYHVVTFGRFRRIFASGWYADSDHSEGAYENKTLQAKYELSGDAEKNELSQHTHARLGSDGEYETFNTAVSQMGKDDSDTISSQVTKIDQATKWLRTPMGYFYTIGDTPLGKQQRQQRDKKTQLKGGSTFTYDTNICVRNFKEAGYSFARTHPSTKEKKAGYLSLFAGYHSHTHKHSDDLSITWGDRGSSILIDPGKYLYKTNDAMRQYIVSTRAHNTIEIDDKTGPRTKEDAYGSGIEQYHLTKCGVQLNGKVNRPGFDVTHSRTVTWLPNHHLIVEDDLSQMEEMVQNKSPEKSSSITTDHAHKYLFWLHFHPQLYLEENANQILIKLNDDIFGFIELGEELKVDRILRGYQNKLTTKLPRGKFYFASQNMHGWHSLEVGKKEPCYSLALQNTVQPNKFRVEIRLS